MTYLVVYGKTFPVFYKKEPLCHLDAFRGWWLESNYATLKEIQEEYTDGNIICLELEWV